MTTLHLDVQVLAFIGGFLLPLLVGLITKQKASSALKAVVLVGLSALSAGITTVVAGGGEVVLKQWLISFAETWITGVATYFGLWRYTITPNLQSLTANFGIGKPVEPEWSAFSDSASPVPVQVGAVGKGDPAAPIGFSGPPSAEGIASAVRIKRAPHYGSWGAE